MGILRGRSLLTGFRCLLCRNELFSDEQGNCFCRICMADIGRVREELFFEAGQGLYHYVGPVRTLIHRYKFEGYRPIGPFMADAFASVIPMDIDATIMALPSGRRAKRRNGWGHMELILKRLAAKGYTVDPNCFGRRPGVAQKELSREDRYLNMRDRLYLRRGISPASYLLIDDVRTTGATLDAARELLLSAGAERVYCLCFAID